MAIKQRLQASQSVAYQTIKNGFLRQKMSHAYLLCGNQGSPLKSMAIFLAQSFLCEQPDPLACEMCLTCIRIEENTYIDVTLLDGELGSIKKEEIDDLQADFSKTALEIGGKKIYIIHLLEQASLGAINSLLKFLEEPGENVIGIITTHNLSKILPTIVSRCQLIRLKNTTKTSLITELLSLGVSQEDAYLLAQDNATIEEIQTIVADPNFQQLKELAIASFVEMVEQESNIHFYIQRQVSPHISSRQDLFVYLQVLETVFKDVTYQNSKNQRVFPRLEYVYAQWQEKWGVHRILETIMYAKGSIDNRVNPALALDRLYYDIMTYE